MVAMPSTSLNGSPSTLVTTPPNSYQNMTQSPTRKTPPSVPSSKLSPLVSALGYPTSQFTSPSSFLQQSPTSTTAPSPFLPPSTTSLVPSTVASVLSITTPKPSGINKSGPTSPRWDSSIIAQSTSMRSGSGFVAPPPSLPAWAVNSTAGVIIAQGRRKSETSGDGDERLPPPMMPPPQLVRSASGSSLTQQPQRITRTPSIPAVAGMQTGTAGGESGRRGSNPATGGGEASWGNPATRPEW
ncbi:hypothetical protein BC829DRAFT_379816 [Chytridium lagenaria]|nr:hypothetical protein BC829DRAFT_379816 [Chytridium lagenaria]